MYKYENACELMDRSESVVIILRNVEKDREKIREKWPKIENEYSSTLSLDFYSLQLS